MAYEKKERITKKMMQEIEEVCRLRKTMKLGCRKCVYNEKCLNAFSRDKAI